MNYNIFRGEKIRLRAKTLADISKDKFEDPNYDSELDRATGGLYFPQSYDARREDEEKAVLTANDESKCALVIETHDGVAVGEIGSCRVHKKDGAFSFWVWLNREHWRKGYASEAAVIFLRYYFNEQRYHKCDSIVYSFNGASIALHRALGFTEEGRLRESIFTNGKYHDVYQFGITADEFNERHPLRGN